MKISVIVTTYNRPDALALVLQGLAAQQQTNFEVLIADDGSGPATLQLVQTLAKTFPVPLIHVWQEDAGFRAGAARNKASAQATGDYLVFIDGDCIPLPDFLSQHQKLAEKNWFVAGNRVLLSESFTQHALSQGLALHQRTRWQWLIDRFNGRLNRWLPLLHTGNAKWRKKSPKRWQGARTCNLAVWRQDFVDVNGFDEAYAGWGHEDADLAVRLIRQGTHRKDGRFATAVMHLWHKENDRSQLQENVARLEQILAGHRTKAQRPQPIPRSPLMNILIVKTSSLGDVIHMLPAITDAAQALSPLHIDWIVEEAFAAIPAWHPAIHNIIPIAMRRWKKHLTQKETWQEIDSARRTLSQKNYDLIIDSQGLLKSALWGRLAKGTRVGYDRQSIREPVASFFYDKKVKVSRQLHAIDRNRQLLAKALGYTLANSGPDYGLQGLQAWLPISSINLPPQSVVALHGTSRDDKLWPIEGWITLAETLKTSKHTLVFPWGNEAEHQRARQIAQCTTNTLVLPKLNLDAMASVLDQAQAVVGVDTGLLHLAAALGKPGLALYTATQPQLTGAISDCHAQSVLQNLSTPETLTPTAVAQALCAVLHK